jgi:thiamine kinase-like enzyme
MTEDRIRALTCWNGPISFERLVGGITNVSYRVHDGNASYVVRICEDRSYLSIDRRNEETCQEAAFRAGVAPELVHSADGILVSRYVNSPPLAADSLRNPALLSRLATTIRTLHDSRDELLGEMLYFCPFQTVRTYSATARRLNAVLPNDLDKYLADAQQLSTRMSSFRPTLCHNDLLAANILDDGEKLWLVDWEYAGIGNPLFDLASISANSQLGDELEAMLIREYAGAVDDQVRREIQILKTVSLLREALWAVIQTVASDIDFDYAQYAAANLTAYQQARRRIDLGR